MGRGNITEPQKPAPVAIVPRGVRPVLGVLFIIVLALLAFGLMGGLVVSKFFFFLLLAAVIVMLAGPSHLRGVKTGRARSKPAGRLT